MNVYLIKDKLSGNVIQCELAENLETYKRHFISVYLDLKKKENYTALRLLHDCDVYEVSFDKDLVFEKAKLVYSVKDFLEKFKADHGSVLDKSE